MAKNKKSIILDRRAKVAKLYLEGYNQYQIGDMLNITQSCVSKDMVKNREQWKSSASSDIKELTLNELAKIDNLEQTYWKAWEKSCEDYQEKSIKAIKKGKKKIKGDNDNKPTSIEQTTKDVKANGNPAYLTGIQNCIDKRCKILGIDAPQKIDVSGTQTINNVTVTPEEVKEINKGLEEEF